MADLDLADSAPANMHDDRLTSWLALELKHNLGAVLGLHRTTAVSRNAAEPYSKYLVTCTMHRSYAKSPQLKQLDQDNAGERSRIDA